MYRLLVPDVHVFPLSDVSKARGAAFQSGCPSFVAGRKINSCALQQLRFYQHLQYRQILSNTFIMPSGSTAFRSFVTTQCMSAIAELFQTESNSPCGLTFTVFLVSLFLQTAI